MNRKDFSKLYSDLWTDGLWAAPWSKAVADLSPEQANWKPAPARKSIWQIVRHVVFWKEYHLNKIQKGATLSNEQIAQQHFSDPPVVSQQAWDQARADLKASHERMAAAMAGDAIAIDKLAPVLAHDCYHLGQVMYVRGMQGLAPLE
jgi:uncharacterized damage-inducible protein DinB